MYQRQWWGLFNGGCLRSEFLYQMKKISGLVSKTCAIGKKSQIQYCSDFSSPNIYLCQRSMNIAVDSGPLDTENFSVKRYTWNPKHRHEIQYWDIAMNWLGKILPICKMTRQWENTSRYQILGLATHCCVSKREAKDLQRRMFAIWESSKRIGNVDLSSIAEVVQHTKCICKSLNPQCLCFLKF